MWGFQAACSSSSGLFLHSTWVPVGFFCVPFPQVIKLAMIFWLLGGSVNKTKLTFVSPFKDIFWRGVCVPPLLTDRTGVDKIYHSTSQEVHKLQPSKWSYSCAPYSNNKHLNIITLINVFVFSPTYTFMRIYPGDMSAYAVLVLLPTQWAWTSPLQCARLHTRVVETLHQHLNQRHSSYSSSYLNLGGRALHLVVRPTATFCLHFVFKPQFYVQNVR